MTAALLLVPVEFVAGSHVLPHVVHAGMVGIATSLATLAVAALMARVGSSTPARVVAAASIAAVWHFALRGLLPRFLHMHGAPLDRALAPAYMLLAVFYIAASCFSARQTRRIWMVFAHIVALAALVVAWWTTPSWLLVGAASLTLALGALTYLIGAAGWRSVLMARIAFALTLGACGLALRWHGIGLVSGWFAYAIAANAIGFVALAASKSASRANSAEFEREAAAFSRYAAAVALAVQVCAIVGCSFALPDIKLTAAHVWGAAAAAGMTFLLLKQIVRPWMAAIWVCYLGVLCDFLIACHAPRAVFLHNQPNIGLGIALAAPVVRWALKQRDDARLCLIGALALTALYGLSPHFVGSTLLALVVLVGMIVLDAAIVSSVRRGAFEPVDAVIGAVALSVLVLVCQIRILPAIMFRSHWDNNAGYGLALLALLFAGMAVLIRREKRGVAVALRGVALAIVALTVMAEFHYTLHDGMVRSPLQILEIGTILCGLIAVFGRSEVSAGATLALVIAAATLFALSPNPLFTPRETALAWTILASSVTFAVLSVRDKKAGWTYAAALLLLVALAVFVHRFTTCPPAGYVLIVGAFDLTMLFMAVALRTVETETDCWTGPLGNVAITTGYAALLPLMAAFDGIPAGSAFRLDTAGFGLMLVVFAALATLTARESYVATASVIASALLLFLMRHAAPHAPTTKWGLYLNYASLALMAAGWLIATSLATGTDREAPRSRYVAGGMARAAVAVAFLGSLLAIIGAGDGPARYALYSVMLTGLVFLGYGGALGNEAVRLAGRIVFGLTMFVYTVMRIQDPGVPIGDFVLAAIGLAAIGVCLLGGRTRPGGADPIVVAAALMVVAPLLAAIWAPHPWLYTAPTAAVACVALIFCGLTIRTWGLTAVGSAGLVALIALAATGHTPRIHWAIFATLLGAVVIGAAMMLERRRTAQARLAAEGESSGDG
jgi:hypothetical protein